MGTLWKIILLVMMLLGCMNCITKEEKLKLKEKAVEMFHHAFNSYMTYAYPADELMPLSCKGRYRGSEPSRGDVDDTLGNFSLSLIDSLDTLVVLGEIDMFEDAVLRLIRDVRFDNDIVVSVFETNIRVLGGLLGGHLMAEHVKEGGARMQWYGGEMLKMATEVADRLMPAFNTSTGIPYPRVNLRHGVGGKESRTGTEKDTCTACAGTMILELSALSRLTGKKIYELKAAKAMDYLWRSRHKTSDLMGVVIDINNGDWVRKESGVGAGIDSYYEYLLKAYIMLGDDTYLDRFNIHYKAIMRYVSNGPLMLDVHMHRPTTNSRNFMDALLAFWPGLQVLKGDLKPAIELHEMLYQVMQRHNFIPEAFTSDFRVHWAQHPLRPEFLESTYFLYKATGDAYYVEVGRQVMQKMNTLARTRCGFASIKDVTSASLEDQMDSFVLAETFKYLYLLFSEKEELGVDVDQFVFSTEAHLLPIFLSSPNSGNNSSDVVGKTTIKGEKEDAATTKSPDDDTFDDDDDDDNDKDDDDDDTCPSRAQRGDFARDVRSPLKDMVEKLCPRGAKSRPSRLRATEFIAGDKQQLQRLSVMGIRLVTKEDGRVQLVHVASQAMTSEDSHEGMLFIQEMIELSKSHEEREPRVVQLLSAPTFGSVVLQAGPAQFGSTFTAGRAVEGVVTLATPKDACADFLNDDVRGKIVVVERGGCMFIEKARQVQKAGGVAMIVTDHTDGSGSFFSMSGDGKDDVAIGAVFLFRAEASVLLTAMQQTPALVLRLGQTPVKTESILLHHLIAKNIYAEADKVVKESIVVDDEDDGGGGAANDDGGGCADNDDRRASGDGNDARLGYHDAKVRRTLSLSLEYLELGALVGVVVGGEKGGRVDDRRGKSEVLHKWEEGGMNGRNDKVEKEGGKDGKENKDEDEERVDKRVICQLLSLSGERSRQLSSLLTEQFPVRVIRQLVPPLPPVDYFREEEEGEEEEEDKEKKGADNDDGGEGKEDVGGGSRDEGAVEKSKRDGIEFKITDENIVVTETTPHKKYRLPINLRPSEHLTSDLGLSFTHLLTTLHHCSDLASLHLTFILNFQETMEALARLVELGFTEGRMMFGVETEKQLGRLSRALTVKEECLMAGKRRMERGADDDDVAAGKRSDGADDDVVARKSGTDDDFAGKINDGADFGADKSGTDDDDDTRKSGNDDDDEEEKEEEEVVRRLAQSLQMELKVVRDSLEGYVEEEVKRLFGELLAEKKEGVMEERDEGRVMEERDEGGVRDGVEEGRVKDGVEEGVSDGLKEDKKEEVGEGQQSDSTQQPQSDDTQQQEQQQHNSLKDDL